MSSGVNVSKGSFEYVDGRGRYTTSSYGYGAAYNSASWVRSDIQNSSSGLISMPYGYGGGMYVPSYYQQPVVVVQEAPAVVTPAPQVSPAPVYPVRRGLFSGPPTIIQFNLNIGFGRN